MGFCDSSEATLMGTEKEFYKWDCDNGTTIYCDHPILCEAKFAADADIGGWGVSFNRPGSTRLINLH